MQGSLSLRRGGSDGPGPGSPEKERSARGFGDTRQFKEIGAQKSFCKLVAGEVRLGIGPGWAGGNPEKADGQSAMGKSDVSGCTTIRWNGSGRRGNSV